MDNPFFWCVMAIWLVVAVCVGSTVGLATFLVWDYRRDTKKPRAGGQGS